MEETENLQKFNFCRLCAQISEKVINIFEGGTNTIQEKINKYLPIVITENDTLPLTMCSACLNTLTEFDTLVTKCKEANDYFSEWNEPTLIQEDVILKSENLKTFCQGELLIEKQTIDNEYDVAVDQNTNEIYTEITIIESPKTEKTKAQSNQVENDSIDDVKEEVDGKVYYRCKVCNKCLSTPYTYKLHTTIHTGEKPLVCDLCGKRFRISQGLARHIAETHEKKKKYSCDLCDRKFYSRRNVNEHRNIHTNERPYVCDSCGKAFKQKASLFVHRRSHTDKFPFSCSYCNQVFRTNSILMRHITRHTGEKPHSCDECGRSFRIKHELTRHKLIHSDNKPFKCDCGLSFRMKRYLKKHLKQCPKQGS